MCDWEFWDYRHPPWCCLRCRSRFVIGADPGEIGLSTRFLRGPIRSLHHNGPGDARGEGRWYRAQCSHGPLQGVAQFGMSAWFGSRGSEVQILSP